jgi:hypothetical protein
MTRAIDSTDGPETKVAGWKTAGLMISAVIYAAATISNAGG